MRLLLFLLLAAPASAGDDGYDDPPAIQRSLAELQLGDSLEEVQRIYPPAQDWPSYVDPRGRVRRYRVERAYAKSFPNRTQALMLGFKRGRLVDIQVIYDAKRSGEKPYEELARDLALTYGDGDRSGNKFWWTDARTVLRVFPVEVPTFKDGARGVEWRTALRVLEKDLYERTD
ncbi:MAG: hypothetical protein HY403_02450 [Elusimicrobia bacterium]|nr:hypothetical protein [Elusimicrobiota bacterium]